MVQNIFFKKCCKKNKDLREEAIKTLKTSKMTNAQALDEFAESLTQNIKSTKTRWCRSIKSFKKYI